MKPQAPDARGAPEKCQVFRAKRAVGMGTITQQLPGPGQSPLPRLARAEQTVSFLNPALEGATCYRSGTPGLWFAAVKCPRDKQAPTDQSSRRLTSLHTASIWKEKKKKRTSASPLKTQFSEGTGGISHTGLTACGSDLK